MVPLGLAEYISALLLIEQGKVILSTRKDTQTGQKELYEVDHLMPLISQYPIFPVKGEGAREHLLRLGCSIGSETITLSDHLKIVPLSGDPVTYAVMHNGEEAFRMQYYYRPNRWRIVVPLRYQMTFVELVRSYGSNNLWTGGVFGSSEVMSQLMGGIPVQRAVAVAALKRLSDYTGHPYDLENVRFALTEETSEEKERETNLVRY
jgi:hypothetical protein